MPLTITDDMRAQMMSVLVAGADCNVGIHCCMCCGPDSRALCADIVGEEYAEALQVYAHDELGCGWNEEHHIAGFNDAIEQTYLDKIAHMSVILRLDEAIDDVVSFETAVTGMDITVLVTDETTDACTAMVD